MLLFFTESLKFSVQPPDVLNFLEYFTIYFLNSQLFALPCHDLELILQVLEVPLALFTTYVFEMVYLTDTSGDYFSVIR